VLEQAVVLQVSDYYRALPAYSRPTATRAARYGLLLATQQKSPNNSQRALPTAIRAPF